MVRHNDEAVQMAEYRTKMLEAFTYNFATLGITQGTTPHPCIQPSETTQEREPSATLTSG